MVVNVVLNVVWILNNKAMSILIKKVEGINVVVFPDKEVKLSEVLVIYGGGGYDGCVVQYNAAYFDHEGSFHNIYSTGVKGCDSEEKMLSKLAVAEDYGDKRFNWYDTEIVDLSEPCLPKFKDWADKQSVELLLKVGIFMREEFGVDLICICDSCHKEFNLADMCGDAAREVNGTPIKYCRALVCQGCYGLRNPVCFECGEDCNIHTGECLNPDCNCSAECAECADEAVVESYLINCEIDKIREALQGGYLTIIESFEAYEVEEGKACVQVSEIVSGASGVYKAHEICMLYEIEGWQDFIGNFDEYNSNAENVTLNDNVWEELIEPYFLGFCSAVSEKIKLNVDAGYTYSIEAGHLEDDGSFGINLVVAKIRNN